MVGDNRAEIGGRDDWAELSSSIGVRGGRARVAKVGGAARMSAAAEAGCCGGRRVGVVVQKKK